MKRFVLFLFCFVFVFSNTKADEGMWLPILIKKLKNVDLEKMGLQLSPEELYSVNSASLKDAIVSFSGYCTGEIISNQGLLLTNHHCGYDAIQNHSSVDSDYLQDGFWAKNKSEAEYCLPVSITVLVVGINELGDFSINSPVSFIFFIFIFISG